MFGEVFWRPQSRAHAAAWDGSGIDPTVVDADALRAAWLHPGRPPWRVALLLQRTWLAQHGHAVAPVPGGAS